MKALITGASSGIGKDIAINLSNMGYEVILVARNQNDLKKVANICGAKAEIYKADLSKIDECKKLFNKYKDIDVLVNNAGFGVFGEFTYSNLDKELNMIDLNVKSVLLLTKLYLKQMIKKDSGIILNVASTAAFLPGPLMSTYYSTKSFVYSLTMAIYEELRRIKSNVKISCLCPGPVDTNFNKVANVSFAFKGLSSSYVAKYAISKMLKGKLIIIPGFTNKLLRLACKVAPIKLLLKVDYNIQRRKER